MSRRSPAGFLFGALALAALVGGLSARMRRLQNGFVRTYALTMLADLMNAVLDPRLRGA